ATQVRFGSMPMVVLSSERVRLARRSEDAKLISVLLRGGWFQHVLRCVQVCLAHPQLGRSKRHWSPRRVSKWKEADCLQTDCAQGCVLAPVSHRHRAGCDLIQRL